MHRTETDHEFESMIRGAAREPELPSIQVTDAVMGRIRALHGKPAPLRRGMTRRTGIAFAGLLTLLLLTVSAYAASEWIQIRTADGKVKVQYAPPAPRQMPAPDSYDKYRALALRMAKPGELIAYLDGAKDAETELRFASKELRMKSYVEFSREMKRAGTPTLPETAAGYPFEYGVVSPDYPNSDSELYRRILKELLAQKDKSPQGALVAKAIPWSGSSWIGATYSKDNAHIGLSANLLHGGDVTVEQEPANKPEQLKAAGRTVIFNNIVRPEVSYHYLNWYNENQDAYYMLTTYGYHILDKTRLVELAGQLIKGGL